MLEGEREKAVGVLVREKDVLLRANFKFLQMLEFKEQAIKAIVKTIEQGEQHVDVVTSLGGQRELEELLGCENREKLMNGRERVKLLSGWLGSR